MSTEIVDAVVADDGPVKVSGLSIDGGRPTFVPLQVSGTDHWTLAICRTIAEYIMKYLVPFWNQIPSNTTSTTIDGVTFLFGVTLSITRLHDISITVYKSGHLELSCHTQVSDVVKMINLVARHNHICEHGARIC